MIAVACLAGGPSPKTLDGDILEEDDVPSDGLIDYVELGRQEIQKAKD